MNENFGVGTVLGTSFRVFFRNLIPFLLIATVLYLPIFAWTMSVFSSDRALETMSSPSFVWGVRILQMILNAFTTATITYGVVKDLQGQRASIGTCISNGFKRMLPALGVGIVMWIAVFGATLLLIVPGLIVYCMLYVSIPVSVLEQPGVFGALRRSRELTQGYKVQVFGILLLLFVMLFGIGLLIGAVMQPTLATIHSYLYVNMALQVVIGAFGAVVAGVTYASLRQEKEGTTANDLASVFE